MNAKLTWTGTAAVLLAWVAAKLWWAPPQELMTALLMALRDACLAGLFGEAVVSIWDKLVEAQRAD